MVTSVFAKCWQLQKLLHKNEKKKRNKIDKANTFPQRLVSMANMQKQSPFCMENAFSESIAFLLHCAFAIIVLCGASTVDASARLQKKETKRIFPQCFLVFWRWFSAHGLPILLHCNKFVLFNCHDVALYVGNATNLFNGKFVACKLALVTLLQTFFVAGRVLVVHHDCLVWQ